MGRKERYRRGIKIGGMAAWPDGVGTPDEVSERVRYTGSTVHKTYDSPAGPPARYADKSKCDHFAVEVWPQLLRALKTAIRSCAIGDFRGSYPSRAWIWINDVLHEARLTNEATGEYHGFPIFDPRQYPEPAARLKDVPRVEIPTVRD